MKKRLFSFLTLSLLIGSQVQATVYAVDKLTKGDKTVYLFSDVPGQSEADEEQKKLILQVAANTAFVTIFADERRDCNNILNTIENSEKKIFVHSSLETIVSVYDGLLNNGWESQVENAKRLKNAVGQGVVADVADPMNLAAFFKLSNSEVSSSHAASSSDGQEMQPVSVPVEEPVPVVEENNAPMQESQPSFTRMDTFVCVLGVASVVGLACVAYKNNFGSWLCKKVGLVLGHSGTKMRSATTVTAANWFLRLSHRLSK